MKKKQVSKIVALAMTTAMALTAFTGCGGSGSSSEPAVCAENSVRCAA